MPNTMGFGSNGAMQPYGSHGLGGLQVAGLRLPTSPPPLAPPFPEPPTATTPYPYNQPLMPIHGDATSWPKVPVNTYGSALDTRYVGQQPSMATQFTLPPTMQVLPGYSPQLQIDTTRKRPKPATVIRAFAVAQQLISKSARPRPVTWLDKATEDREDFSVSLYHQNVFERGVDEMDDETAWAFHVKLEEYEDDVARRHVSFLFPEDMVWTWGYCDADNIFTPDVKDNISAFYTDDGGTQRRVSLEEGSMIGYCWRNALHVKGRFDVIKNATYSPCLKGPLCVLSHENAKSME